MNKKIIFQKCNFNNIYFLFYIIMNFINLLIEYELYPNNIEVKESASKYFLAIQIINFLYIHNISDFLAIIPYFIRKKLLKKKEENKNKTIEEKEENKDNKNIDDSPLIYNENTFQLSDQKKKITILNLILISFLDFLQKFVFILYSIIYPDNEIIIYTFSCTVPFEIILQFICSYFILKIHFNKLQNFSLFLNLAIFIIILVIDIFNIIYKQSCDEKMIYLYGLSIIFYSIEFSLVKKILLNGFIYIYLFMIIKGLLLFFFVALFSVIIFFTKREDFIRIGFFLTHTKYILLIIAKIFSNFFVNLFIWLIIDRFSPNYFPFALIFNEICYFIVDIIYGENDYKIMGWDMYVRIFLYAISFIGVLIHNEIVVINICNLGSDTKYFLDLKVRDEEEFSKANDPQIMKKFESFSENEEVNEGNEN